MLLPQPKARSSISLTRKLVTRQAQVEAVGDLFSKKQYQLLGTYIGDIVLLEI
jgi:hypothetical protein